DGTGPADIVADEGPPALDDKLFAILGDLTEVTRPLSLRQHRCPGTVHFLPVAVEQAVGARLLDLLVRVAGQSLGALVPVDDAPVQVVGAVSVGPLVQKLGLLTYLLLGPLALAVITN